MGRRTFLTTAGLWLLLTAALLSGRFVPPQHDRANSFLWLTALVSFGSFRLWSANRHDKEILRRIDHGLCRRCGYDLRASDTTCPECGRPFHPHEKVPLRHRNS